ISLLSKQRMKHIEIIEFTRRDKPKPKQLWNFSFKKDYDIMFEEMQEEKIMLEKVLSWICENKSHFKSLCKVYLTYPWQTNPTIIRADKLKQGLKSNTIMYGYSF